MAGRARALLASDLGRMVALAFVYYVVARLSLHFALVGENVTPIWPPTGIAVFAFLRYGRRLWPAVFAAALAVNAPISATWWAAIGTAAGNTLAPLLAAVIVVRTETRTDLGRTRDAVALVLAALLSMMLSATIGTAMLAASGAIGPMRVLATWSVWWAGDTMGVLIVAPFFLTLSTPHFGHWAWARRLEALALSIAVVAGSVLVVTSDLPVLFLALLPVGWAAWRFQQAGAAPAALVVSAVTTWAAAGRRGPFEGGSLLDEMLVLQAFNASIAVTSFVFAAVVTERGRARTELERSAAELEERVRLRTLELTRTNERLAFEVAERSEAERALRQRERELAEAQEVASIGSYRWDLSTGEVRWSDELFRIHGHPPQSFAVTLESALDPVFDDEDREQIRRNISHALEHRRARLPEVEYRIRRPDGEERFLRGSARLAFASDGTPTAMHGTVQDVTARRAHEREHRIAETLQLALLPQEMFAIAGVDVATRYLPAEEGAHAGGDWYDVFPLDQHRVALVIGDAAGHGISAASAMGQARMAVRAYALSGEDPITLVRRTDDILARLHPGQMVTLLYLTLDTRSREVCLVGAGHPPPLLLSRDGGPSYVEMHPGAPLGLGIEGDYAETRLSLAPGSTLVLYTDGLIDRSDISIDVGLERLVAVADAGPREDLEALCDAIIDGLTDGPVSDDVALVSLRATSPATDLHLTIGTDTRELATVRRAVAAWLADLATEEVVDDVVLACSEACANAIEHAYRSGPGEVIVRGAVDDGVAIVVVRDHGSWREPRASDRGRGLSVIEGCMDTVVVSRLEEGTEVRMTRALAA